MSARWLGIWGTIWEQKAISAPCAVKKAGPFTAADAISLDMPDGMDYGAARDACLLPLRCVLDDIPALALKGKKRQGCATDRRSPFITRPDFERLTRAGLGKKESILALVLHDDAPVALVEQERAEIRPVRVFNL